MTDTTQVVEGVIRTDVLGRVRTSAARRESLLGEYDQSGLSAKKFAEVSGIKYQTLATWLQKRCRQGKTPGKAANTVRWLEAMVERAQNPAAQPAASVILRLPCGVQMELADAKQIPMAAALVRALIEFGVQFSIKRGCAGVGGVLGFGALAALSRPQGRIAPKSRRLVL